MNKRSLMAAAAAVALVFTAPLSASAHSSATPNPADGETVTTLPAEFSVTASDPFFTGAGDAGFGLLVQDAAGLYYGNGCLTIDAATISMPASLGAPGTYTMTWQFTSGDSHPTQGNSSFEWAPAAEAEEATGSSEAPTCVPEEEPAAPGIDDETAAPTGSDDSTSTGSDATDPGALPWVIGGIVAVLLAAGITYGVLRRRAAND